jgi:GNAT superfamily N-acetyltransferase
MEVTIRNAEEHDFNQIIDLFKEFAAFEKLSEKMVNTAERMKTEKDLFNCYVAETKDKMLIGYVTHFVCYYTWIGKSLYMDDLYVKPDFRGKGIGTLLIKKVIEYAKLTNCHKLRWQVSKWNTPAIDFYKSLGAEIDSTEQNCDLLLN